jgi:hypothetical protein
MQAVRIADKDNSRHEKQRLGILAKKRYASLIIPHLLL